MYTVSLALTLASTVLALAAVSRPRLRLWAAYVAVSLLALHVHYFAVFVLLAQNLFVLGYALVGREWRRAGQWLLAQAALALLYLPWLLAARDTLTSYQGNGDSPALAAMLLRAGSVFAVGESIPAAQRLTFALLALALLTIGVIRLARAGRAGRRALWLLALYLATPLLATWFSALSRPIFNERYLIAASPPFFLLLAVAVLGARERRVEPGRLGGEQLLGWASLALLALLLVGSLASLGRYYTDPAYSKTRGWRDLAATLTRYSAGLDPSQVRLAENFPDPTLWYYYTGPVDHLVLPPGPHDRAGRRAGGRRPCRFWCAAPDPAGAVRGLVGRRWRRPGRPGRALHPAHADAGGGMASAGVHPTAFGSLPPWASPLPTA